MTLALIAGCSHTEDDLTSPWDDVPAEEIYADADAALKDGRFTDAVEIFDEVERQYPYSRLSRRALLMGAYANYARNEYDDAILAAERYIALYPADENTAYAHYLIAMSYYERIGVVGRDQYASEKALEAFDEIVNRFPDSDYARDARLKRDAARDQIAGHSMEIGRFYQKRGDFIAAIGRFWDVVGSDDDYGLTAHTPEALGRLVECYTALGLNEEARKAAAILGHNYPETSWYRRSYAMIENPESLQRPDNMGWLQNFPFWPTSN